MWFPLKYSCGHEGRIQAQRQPVGRFVNVPCRLCVLRAAQLKGRESFAHTMNIRKWKLEQLEMMR